MNQESNAAQEYFKSKDPVQLEALLSSLIATKPFEAKTIMGSIVQGLSELNNEQVINLGEHLYPRILGSHSLEKECFEIAENLWKIFSVRGELDKAIKYFESINLESPIMYLL